MHDAFRRRMGRLDGSFPAAPEECDNLCSGADGTGTESSFGDTVGNAAAYGPQYRGGTVAAALYIGKGIGNFACRGFLTAPEERNDLTAGTGCIGAEGDCGCAVGNAVFSRPLDCIIIDVRSSCLLSHR